MDLQIRTAQVHDADAAARIYGHYVRHTPVTFEEAVPSAEEMSRRIATTLAKFPFLVAEADGEVIGYVYASSHGSRASYRWSVDVGVYIDHRFHRQGVGYAMYSRLLPMLADRGFAMAFAGITLPNNGSVGLHQRFGFQPVGVYRNVGYKLGHWRDVGWYELQLQPTLPNPPAEPQSGMPRPQY